MKKKSRWEALAWTAVSIIPAAGLAVKTYGKTIKNIVKATSKHLPQNITKTVKKTTQKITNTTRKTKNKINQIKNNTKQKITNTKNKITNGIGNTRNKIKEQIAQTIENMEYTGRVIVHQAMGLQPAYAHAGARNTRTIIRKAEPTPQAKDNVWARSANKNRSSNSRKSSSNNEDPRGNLYGVSKTPLDVIKSKTSEYTISKKRLGHIIENHMDENHNPTKTKFVDDISKEVLSQLIEKVMNDPDRIVRYNTKGRTGYIVTAKVDMVLAVEKGENLYTLKVVIDENIKVTTAYAIR